MQKKKLLENIVIGSALAAMTLMSCSDRYQANKIADQTQVNTIEITPEIYRIPRNGKEVIMVTAEYSSTNGRADPRRVSQIALQSYTEDHLSKDIRLKGFKTIDNGMFRDINYGANNRLAITYESVTDQNGNDITQQIIKTLPEYTPERRR